MSFTIRRGKTKKTPLPVTPSTAFAKDSLVTFSSGKLIPATSSTASVDIIGIIPKAIASTDTDYASDRLVPILVPLEKYTVCEADVTSGLVAADVGLEVDLTDASTVNRGANSVKVVKCVQVLSTTKGLFQVKFGGSY
jgi:hypothetical protein